MSQFTSSCTNLQCIDALGTTCGGEIEKSNEWDEDIRVVKERHSTEIAFLECFAENGIQWIQSLQKELKETIHERHNEVIYHHMLNILVEL